MKVALALFLLCTGPPLGPEELQLSVISNNATHRDVWRLAQAALQRAGIAAVPREVPVERALELTPLYLYLHKRHAALVPRIAEMLRRMRVDGTMQRITSQKGAV